MLEPPGMSLLMAQALAPLLPQHSAGACLAHVGMAGAGRAQELCGILPGRPSG